MEKTIKLQTGKEISIYSRGYLLKARIIKIFKNGLISIHEENSYKNEKWDFSTLRNAMVTAEQLKLYPFGTETEIVVIL